MADTRHTIRDLEQLGRLVRERREAAGLSLDRAAALLGVGRRFLIELEHGKRRANAETLLRVLNALGLEMVVETRTPARTAAADAPGERAATRASDV
jgi:HTH-type transcriptional regulator/antitoxin HipB